VAPKKAIVKKDVKSKMAAKNGCDGRLIAKILISTIQVNLVPNRSETWGGNTNSAELVLLKFLLLVYRPSQPFLAATLDFTSIFTIATITFLGAAHFLQLGCFWIRLLYIMNYCYQMINLGWGTCPTRRFSMFHIT